MRSQQSSALSDALPSPSCVAACSFTALRGYTQQATQMRKGRLNARFHFARHSPLTLKAILGKESSTFPTTKLYASSDFVRQPSTTIAVAPSCPGMAKRKDMQSGWTVHVMLRERQKSSISSTETSSPPLDVLCRRRRTRK